MEGVLKNDKCVVNLFTSSYWESWKIANYVEPKPDFGGYTSATIGIIATVLILAQVLL